MGLMDHRGVHMDGDRCLQDTPSTQSRLGVKAQTPVGLLPHLSPSPAGAFLVQPRPGCAVPKKLRAMRPLIIGHVARVIERHLSPPSDMFRLHPIDKAAASGINQRHSSSKPRLRRTD